MPSDRRASWRAVGAAGPKWVRSTPLGTTWIFVRERPHAVRLSATDGETAIALCRCRPINEMPRRPARSAATRLWAVKSSGNEQCRCARAQIHAARAPCAWTTSANWGMTWASRRAAIRSRANESRGAISSGIVAATSGWRTASAVKSEGAATAHVISAGSRPSSKARTWVRIPPCAGRTT